MQKSQASLLAALAVVGLVGCSSGGVEECTTVSGSNKAQYVANTLTLPPSSRDFAFDANGSGPKNQLGNLIAGLSTMLDPQSAVNTALTNGSLILLTDEISSDATFQSDTGCASSTISIGKSMPMPDFTGAGTFTVDMAGATFKGKITAGKFASNPTKSTTMPVGLTIPLPLVQGAPAVMISVTGAQLTYTRDATGKVSGGVLNGVIKKTDVDTKVIPSVAVLLNNTIAAAATGTADQMKTAKSLLDFFDNGGAADPACGMACKNLDGSCAAKGDGKVGDCELSTSSVIMNFLRADVQMFDAAGNWKPNADNTTKDALTLGLGFTAVKATY
jgi:hypothetical protein